MVKRIKRITQIWCWRVWDNGTTYSDLGDGNETVIGQSGRTSDGEERTISEGKPKSDEQTETDWIEEGMDNRRKIVNNIGEKDSGFESIARHSDI